ncbi:MAG: hypothetical protein ACOYXA_13995 [Bacteroidota bacterium]
MATSRESEAPPWMVTKKVHTFATDGTDYRTISPLDAWNEGISSRNR